MSESTVPLRDQYNLQDPCQCVICDPSRRATVWWNNLDLCYLCAKPRHQAVRHHNFKHAFYDHTQGPFWYCRHCPRWICTEHFYYAMRSFNIEVPSDIPLPSMECVEPHGEPLLTDVNFNIDELPQQYQPSDDQLGVEMLLGQDPLVPAVPNM